MAKQVSTDTSVQSNGGDLGWQPRGYFVQEFEDAVFGLPVMQISDPVTTTYGVHIIEVLEKDPNHPLEGSALEQKRANALEDWLKQVRADADTIIERFFSTEYVPSEIRRLQTPAAGQ